MIFDAILGFICAVPNMLLNSLTSMGEIWIPEGTFNWWYNIFSTLSYVFPIWSLINIILTSFAIKGLQIGWSLLLRAKSFIPTMGS